MSGFRVAGCVIFLDKVKGDSDIEIFDIRCTKRFLMNDCCLFFPKFSSLFKNRPAPKTFLDRDFRRRSNFSCELLDKFLIPY